MKRINFIAMTAGLLALLIAGAASAKSMYVISGLSRPLKSYDIGGNGKLTYQAQNNITYYSGGAVDLTIDTDSKVLFVVYEFSNRINIVDATTMKSLGTTTMPMGSARAAGIVYDHTNKRLYAAYRGYGKVFSFAWNAVTKKLTYLGTFGLSSCRNIHGLALDEANGIMYAGCVSKALRYYNVNNNFSHMGYLSVAHNAVGVAVDTTRNYLWTGGNSQGTYGNASLCRHNLVTHANTCTLNNVYARGVAVDSDTGYVYVTSPRNGTSNGGHLKVYDSNLNHIQTLVNQGVYNITGLVVPGKDISYNPLALTKTDDVSDCESAGGKVTYTIAYDSSGNTYNVDNATLVDTLPLELGFVSASNGGTFDSVTRKVTWNLGTINAGTTGSVTLVVDILSGTPAGAEITNSVTVDSDQTPPTTVTEKTTVCTNRPPVAKCQNVTASADATTCKGCGDVNNGSSDPDGDPITLSYNPSCTATGFGLGGTTVTLTVTDDKGASDTCTGVVTVKDTTAPALTCEATVAKNTDAGKCYATHTIDAQATDCNGPVLMGQTPAGSQWNVGSTTATTTASDAAFNVSSCETTINVTDNEPPTINCNAQATIIPPDAPISFTATTADNCGATAQVTAFDCWKINGSGKRVDKTGSCVVSMSGDTVTITDSGGVGDNIDWWVTSTDVNGNVTTAKCSLTVLNPGNGGGNNGNANGKGCNQGIGNGAEGCDPGNSAKKGSNDEGDSVPGKKGKK